MDTNRFDAVCRTLSAPPSRRSLLRLGAVGGFAAVLEALEAEAKKKKRKKKKKKKPKPPCVPDCLGKYCGSDGCGGSCGPCVNGDCVDGLCECSGHVQCVPGLCCVTGEVCTPPPQRTCRACRVGDSPCVSPLPRCGFTELFECFCATTVEDEVECIGGLSHLDVGYCTACDSNADCETLLGLPGEAVCIDLECLCATGTACAVKGCTNVEFCDTNADCSSGTCQNHRCQ